MQHKNKTFFFGWSSWCTDACSSKQNTFISIPVYVFIYGSAFTVYDFCSIRSMSSWGFLGMQWILTRGGYWRLLTRCWLTLVAIGYIAGIDFVFLFFVGNFIFDFAHWKKNMKIYKCVIMQKMPTSYDYYNKIFCWVESIMVMSVTIHTQLTSVQYIVFVCLLFLQIMVKYLKE